MNSKGTKGYSVVDLFCGVGGLTHGFKVEGFSVSAGIDSDPSCEFAYEANNKPAKFINKRIEELTSDEILKQFKEKDKKILVGCAPCQPFSSYSNTQKSSKDGKWKLLYDFANLIEAIQPEIVSMENVPMLMKFTKQPVLEDFVGMLKRNKYEVWTGLVYCPNYGIPQTRTRFVLLASKLGEINLIAPTHSKEQFVTVKDVISELPKIEDGESCASDQLHRSSKLSELNKVRLKQSTPGGTWRDWDRELLLECHKKPSGKSYASVYGRMKWDEPAPTMTTMCIGIGNGRFGHPEQDRGISLREAALFQTFPEGYQFIDPAKPFTPTIIARHIGNAVPVTLGQVIAKSIKNHLKKYGK